MSLYDIMYCCTVQNMSGQLASKPGELKPCLTYVGMLSTHIQSNLVIDVKDAKRFAAENTVTDL